MRRPDIQGQTCDRWIQMFCSISEQQIPSSEILITGCVGGMQPVDSVILHIPRAAFMVFLLQADVLRMAVFSLER